VVVFCEHCSEHSVSWEWTIMWLWQSSSKAGFLKLW
jgi:hypothetical protein